ncbi:hypothetical protein V8E36_009572 [Tilletia maclaganii]
MNVTTKHLLLFFAIAVHQLSPDEGQITERTFSVPLCFPSTIIFIVASPFPFLSDLSFILSLPSWTFLPQTDSASFAVKEALVDLVFPSAILVGSRLKPCHCLTLFAFLGMTSPLLRPVHISAATSPRASKHTPLTC